LSIPEENLRNIAAIARDEAPSGGVSNRIQAVNLNGRRLWFQINMIKGFAMSQFNLLLLQDITELMDLRLIRGKARNFHGLLYQSEEMETLVDRLKVMARTDLPVFIHGETGTGKEMVARAIHAESLRSGNPFIAINCAGLADSLLNSQLFGHRRGSFTGAIADQKGYFELADGGTLFLDEIADASPDVQKSILRVLEDGVLYPVGSPHPVKVSVRVIAATNIDIQSADKLAELRADLFYRLSAVKAFLPPLRRRPDDIPMLAEYFLRGLCNTTGASKSVLLSKDAFARLLRYPWPGNVRELKNAITVAYFSIKEGVIDAADLPAEPLQWAYVGSEANRLVISAENRGANDAVDEKSALLQTLSDCGGNRSKACEKLGLSRSTFYRRLRKYGLG
jgi:transcriptional regulator with PAS, ATPase and Fis domain